MRHDFGWDYPPGVTGNEPEIAGYGLCANCGHDYEEHYSHYDEEEFEEGPCKVEFVKGNVCSCKGYSQYHDIDPDEARAQARGEI